MKEGSKIVLIGVGYVLRELAKEINNALCIVRSEERNQELKKLGHLTEIISLPSKELGKALVNVSRDAIIIDSTPPPKNATLDIALSIKEAAISNGLSKIIYLSSTSVYGINDGSIVTEDQRAIPDSEAGRERLLVEDFYLKNFDRTCILRLSGIYGPNRGIGKLIKSNKYPLQDLDRYTNRIHRNDIVQFILKIIENFPKSSEVFNVSDDLPIKVREVLKLYKDRFNIEPVMENGRSQRFSKQINNSKMKKYLGKPLLYPSIYEGCGEEFKLE